MPMIENNQDKSSYLRVHRLAGAFLALSGATLIAGDYASIADAVYDFKIENICQTAEIPEGYICMSSIRDTMGIGEGVLRGVAGIALFSVGTTTLLRSFGYKTKPDIKLSPTFLSVAQAINERSNNSH